MPTPSLRTTTTTLTLLAIALGALCVPSVAAAEDIITLDMLTERITAGPLRKVAFLSQANADSVHTVLPASVEVVICDGKKSYYGVSCAGTDGIVAAVRGGEVLAGLISGLPETEVAPFLHTFSSTMISPRAMLMAPDVALDMPHGVGDAAKSSADLSLAVDAAIVSLQAQGIDEQIRLANMPFEFMKVHTCKGSDMSAFAVPDRAAATGLLRSVLDSKELIVGALGPYDWGGNDGNYKVGPPYKGYYPAWYDAFCELFNKLAGPDGVAYGGSAGSSAEIKCTRKWQLSSNAVFRDLFDGASHVTEPYYVIDSFYYGTKETCNTTADCRPARGTASGRENCQAQTDPAKPKQCTHPTSPRKRFFRASCSTLGVDSTFLTAKAPADTSLPMGKPTYINEVSPGAIAGLTILCAVLVIGLVLLFVLIRREKSGKPMFSPLLTHPTNSNSNNNGQASSGNGGDEGRPSTMNKV